MASYGSLVPGDKAFTVISTDCRTENPRFSEQTRRGPVPDGFLGPIRRNCQPGDGGVRKHVAYRYQYSAKAQTLSG